MAVLTKEFAEESKKTQKARKKIQQKIHALNQEITSEHLQKKRIEIHQWIARHSEKRIILNTKALSLFDENQNAAGLSRKIQRIADQLQNENHSIQKPHKVSRFSKEGSSCSKSAIKIASSYEKYH